MIRALIIATTISISACSHTDLQHGVVRSIAGPVENITMKPAQGMCEYRFAGIMHDQAVNGCLYRAAGIVGPLQVQWEAE